MSGSPKFHQITNKYKSRIEKRKKERSVGNAKHRISFFYEHGEEVPVCDNSSGTAAAQQQHSSSISSTAEAAAAAVVAAKAA